MISEMEVRRIPFDFTGVDFLWNPSNPEFSVMINSVTFVAIGLEKYFCRTVLDAQQHITSKDVQEEAQMFNVQESLHTQAHRKHAKALIERYPRLQEVLDACIANFDALYRSHDLKYNLAYAASIEATFTPLFRTIIEHRDVLFGGGDSRVTALLLWHFCEEIEHRSAALAIFDHVIGRPWYRLRESRGVLAHIAGLSNEVVAGFEKHVPNVPKDAMKKSMVRLPRLAKIMMSLGVFESQLPWHKPARATVPEYYYAWRRHFSSGADMTKAYDA